jgi:hypothetical protein
MQSVILLRRLLCNFLDPNSEPVLPQKHCDGDDRRGQDKQR